MPGRFFQGFEWRYLFADIPEPRTSGGSLGGVTTSWANGILTNRRIALTLDQSAVIEADVDSDNRQVNELFSDGFPRVAQQKRIVYAFRREGPYTLPGSSSVQGPWRVRAAGILMSPEDQGTADLPLTHIVAYDPWKYLEARPLMITVSGDPALPRATTIPAAAQGWLTGDAIVTGVLKNTIDYDGFAFVDAGLAYGGTSFYGGTIETTQQIDFEISRGLSVADVWTQLCDSGNLDIVLTPIYDPDNRPGYTHELNVYALAGVSRPSAVFGWDMMSRAVTNIDRAHDGTPANFINTVQYYGGAGGAPIPVAGPLVNNASIDAFLPYWSMQMFPDQAVYFSDTVLALAQQQLLMRKQGLRTMTLDPTPERSPVPLLDYTLGDRVAVWTTKRLRVATSDSFATTPAAAFRVQAIPIVINDDGIEQVTALLTSPDWRTESLPPGSG